MRCSVSNKIILFFIDGVGIGDNNPAYNPCCYSETGIFNTEQTGLPYGGQKYSLDARLGKPGLPQSASGHTTLYTGKNAPEIIGKHLFGFPNAALRKLLQEYSIFVKLRQNNIPCKFINAFRPIFFTTPEIFQNLHMSATTEMNKYAGFPFSDFQQIRDKKALYHDYTNTEIILKGFQLPSFTAGEAAAVLIGESARHPLVLYEYFLTDFAGHARDMDNAIAEIRKVEKLISEILKKMPFNDTTLIVVSDHGNIEDLRTKSHTLNPAFMAIWKSRAIKMFPAFNSLQDIHPFVLSVLTAG